MITLPIRHIRQVGNHVFKHVFIHNFGYERTPTKMPILASARMTAKNA